MMNAVTRSTFFVALMFHATVTAADANDGQLFGYTIGDQHDVHPDTPYNGTQLIRVPTHSAVKPNEIDQVFVIVTTMTHTIGKIEGETWYQSGEDALVAYERFRMILRQKYTSWKTEEHSEQHLHFSRFWSGDYDLNVEVSGPHGNEQMETPDRPFRFRLSLGYYPGTTAATNLEALVRTEFEQAGLDRYSKEDLQGL